MNLQLLIYIKRSKLSPHTNTAPLYLRITLHGNRAEMALKRSINPGLWDNDRQLVKGRGIEANSINEQIRVFKNRVYDVYTKLFEKDEFVSAETVKNVFLGKNQERKTIVQAFTYHNNKMAAQIGKEYANGTHERYQTCLKLLQEFMRSHFKKEDYPLEDMNHQYLTEFDFYLRTQRNCNNNTTFKYLKNLKKITNMSMAMGWLKHNPYLNYKGKLDIVEREKLTQEEIEALINKRFSIPRLNEIKDVFLFCCYTGLAYSDVKKLSKDNIYKGIDGNTWIHINRTKTDVPSRIPLLPVALDILKKYENDPRCATRNQLLPVPSNQKCNAYLKEIADCCGINKNLTTHTARHTFATSITLENGIPMETVSKMLGHRTIKTTEHYSKVSDSKIAKDMGQLLNQQKNKEFKKIKLIGNAG